MPDQLVNLDMKHGVEAKNYEEVSVGVQTVCFLLLKETQLVDWVSGCGTCGCEKGFRSIF